MFHDKTIRASFVDVRDDGEAAQRDVEMPAIKILPVAQVDLCRGWLRRDSEEWQVAFLGVILFYF